MFLLIRGWMDGWPVEDETGWDGVAAAGMPVEWCKPKWNGLGWIAWRSLQGCDWGQLRAVIYRGMQLRGLWALRPKLLRFCCCWVGFACSSKPPSQQQVKGTPRN